MASMIDELVLAVADQKTVIDGAVTLITGFSTALADINLQLANVEAQLALAGADTTELTRVNALVEQLHTDVETQTNELATAVATVPPTKA